MIVTEVLGKLDPKTNTKQVDELPIEWHETSKRIQHLSSLGGEEVIIRFMGEGQALHDGDIVFEDDIKAIVVRILPCKVIVLQPNNWLVMGSACYEIGNKHMPLFIENNKVMMPYEEPMYTWLLKNGYEPVVCDERLINKLSANVENHHHHH